MGGGAGEEGKREGGRKKKIEEESETKPGTQPVLRPACPAEKPKQEPKLRLVLRVGWPLFPGLPSPCAGFRPQELGSGRPGVLQGAWLPPPKEYCRARGPQPSTCFLCQEDSPVAP